MERLGIKDMQKVGIKETKFDVRIAKIVKTKKMTAHEKLFEIALEGGESFDYEPGQFIMISVFGAGEIPISLTSAPTNRITFDICVRAVGKVTNAIHKLEAGDLVGIRGPYGKGFPIRLLEGNDLLIVAGGLGIAPLRSIINYVLENRRDFGKVHILLGCKSPGDILFFDEIEQWNKRLDVHYECTVDRAVPEWQGH